MQYCENCKPLPSGVRF